MGGYIPPQETQAPQAGGSMADQFWGAAGMPQNQTGEPAPTSQPQSSLTPYQQNMQDYKQSDAYRTSLQLQAANPMGGIGNQNAANIALMQMSQPQPQAQEVAPNQTMQDDFWSAANKQPSMEGNNQGGKAAGGK